MDVAASHLALDTALEELAGGPRAAGLVANDVGRRRRVKDIAAVGRARGAGSDEDGLGGGQGDGERRGQAQHGGGEAWPSGVNGMRLAVRWGTKEEDEEKQASKEDDVTRTTELSVVCPPLAACGVCWASRVMHACIQYY